MHIHSLAEFNYNYYHAIVARVLMLLSTCAIRHLLWVGVCIHTYQVVCAYTLIRSFHRSSIK